MVLRAIVEPHINMPYLGFSPEMISDHKGYLWTYLKDIILLIHFRPKFSK